MIVVVAETATASVLSSAPLVVQSSKSNVIENSLPYSV